MDQRRDDPAVINEAGHAIEQKMLGDHVGGLEGGAGEHELSVQRERLGLQPRDVGRLGVVDERDRVGGAPRGP